MSIALPVQIALMFLASIIEEWRMKLKQLLLFSFIPVKIYDSVNSIYWSSIWTDILIAFDIHRVTIYGICGRTYCQRKSHHGKIRSPRNETADSKLPHQPTAMDSPAGVRFQPRRLQSFSNQHHRFSFFCVMCSMKNLGCGHVYTCRHW